MLSSDFKCHFSKLLNQSCNNNSFNLLRQLVAGQLIRFVHPKLNCISASLNSIFLIEFCHYCCWNHNSLLLTAEEYPVPDKALKHGYTHFLLHQPGVLLRTLRGGLHQSWSPEVSLQSGEGSSCFQGMVHLTCFGGLFYCTVSCIL